MVLKTPHTITLIYGDEPVKRYNPKTGLYEAESEETYKKVPCLFNFISQEQVFRDYGSKHEKMAIVRFNQEQQPFIRAIYQGVKYKPYDQIDAPIKGAVRLVKVVE